MIQWLLDHTLYTFSNQLVKLKSIYSKDSLFKIFKFEPWLEKTHDDDLK